MAAHPWSEDELDEFVNPKLGIIEGVQALLEEPTVLRVASAIEGADELGISVQVNR